MQITLRDLSDNLITDFNYHDALIINITKVNNNVTILLKDGFNEGQINELKFVNCEIQHKYNIENRIIYQLDDLVNFNGRKWHMSFLIWTNDELLEKICIESDNIISKKYTFKYDIYDKLSMKAKKFKQKYKEFENQVGKITYEKLNDDNVKKIFNVKEEYDELLDLNNYNLIHEENLNKVAYDKK